MMFSMSKVKLDWSINNSFTGAKIQYHVVIVVFKEFRSGLDSLHGKMSE